MEFKKAYFLLGEQIGKYKGRTVGHKKSNDLYTITHLYLGLKYPQPNDYKFIEENNLNFICGVNTAIYTLLKNKECKIFIRLVNEENDSFKDISLDEMKNEYVIAETVT